MEKNRSPEIDLNTPGAEGDAEEASGPSPDEVPVAPSGKYPEWDRLQEDVARQIRANRRFLERCLEDEFPEEDWEEEGAEEDPEDDVPVG